MSWLTLLFLLPILPSLVDCVPISVLLIFLCFLRRGVARQKSNIPSKLQNIEKRVQLAVELFNQTRTGFEQMAAAIEQARGELNHWRTRDKANLFSQRCTQMEEELDQLSQSLDELREFPDLMCLTPASPQSVPQGWFPPLLINFCQGIMQTLHAGASWVHQQTLFTAARAEPESNAAKRLRVYVEQLDHFNLLIQEEPHVALHYSQRAEIHRQLGSLDRALADAKKGVDLAPDHYLTHFGLARVYEAMGDYPEAVQKFAKSYQLNPYSPVGNPYYRAIAAIHMGHLDVARKALLEAYLEDITIDAWGSYHFYLALVENDANKKLGGLEKAITLGLVDPVELAKAHYLLATLYADQGNSEKAIQAMDQATAIHPRSLSAFDNYQLYRGVLELVKDPKGYERAKPHLDQAARLGVNVEYRSLDLFHKMKCPEAGMAYFEGSVKDRIEISYRYPMFLGTLMLQKGGWRESISYYRQGVLHSKITLPVISQKLFLILEEIDLHYESMNVISLQTCLERMVGQIGDIGSDAHSAIDAFSLGMIHLLLGDVEKTTAFLSLASQKKSLYEPFLGLIEALEAGEGEQTLESLPLAQLAKITKTQFNDESLSLGMLGFVIMAATEIQSGGVCVTPMTEAFLELAKKAFDGGDEFWEFHEKSFQDIILKWLMNNKLKVGAVLGGFFLVCIVRCIIQEKPPALPQEKEVAGPKKEKKAKYVREEVVESPPSAEEIAAQALKSEQLHYYDRFIRGIFEGSADTVSLRVTKIEEQDGTLNARIECTAPKYFPALETKYEEYQAVIGKDYKKLQCLFTQSFDAPFLWLVKATVNREIIKISDERIGERRREIEELNTQVKTSVEEEERLRKEEKARKKQERKH